MENLRFEPIAGTQNVESATDGKYLYLRLERDVQGTRSASGKTMVISSTRGNVKQGELHIGLNVYKK